MTEYVLLQNTDNGLWYSLIDFSLTQVPIVGTEPTKEEFVTYGNEAPSANQILTLGNYRILTATVLDDVEDEIPSDTNAYSVIYDSGPLPQLMKLSEPAVISDVNEYKFASIEVDISLDTDAIFSMVISYDNNTWWAYSVDNSQWHEVNYTMENIRDEGMLLNDLDSLNGSIFDLLYTEEIVPQMYIAFVIESVPNDSWVIEKIIVKIIEKE